MCSIAASISISDIQNELSDVTEWYPLGLELGVPSGKLKQIEKNHHGDTERCKLEMIDFWLHNSGNPSWGGLAKALQKIGGRARLVQSLLRKEGESNEDSEREVELKDVLYELRDFCGCYSLGIHLGIKKSILDKIRYNCNLRLDPVEASKIEIVEYWLENHENPSWSTLVSALHVMGKKGLARRVADKYGAECSPVTTNTLPTEESEETGAVEIESLQKELELKDVHLQEMELCQQRLERHLEEFQKELDDLKRSVQFNEQNHQRLSMKLARSEQETRNLEEKNRRLAQNTKRGITSPRHISSQGVDIPSSLTGAQAQYRSKLEETQKKGGDIQRQLLAMDSRVDAISAELQQVQVEKQQLKSALEKQEREMDQCLVSNDSSTPAPQADEVEYYNVIMCAGKMEIKLRESEVEMLQEKLKEREAQVTHLTDKLAAHNQKLHAIEDHIRLQKKHESSTSACYAYAYGQTPAMDMHLHEHLRAKLQAERLEHKMMLTVAQSKKQELERNVESATNKLGKEKAMHCQLEAHFNKKVPPVVPPKPSSHRSQKRALAALHTAPSVPPEPMHHSESRAPTDLRESPQLRHSDLHSSWSCTTDHIYDNPDEILPKGQSPTSKVVVQQEVQPPLPRRHSREEKQSVGVLKEEQPCLAGAEHSSLNDGIHAAVSSGSPPGETPDIQPPSERNAVNHTSESRTFKNKLKTIFKANLFKRSKKKCRDPKEVQNDTVHKFHTFAYHDIHDKRPQEIGSSPKAKLATIYGTNTKPPTYDSLHSYGTEGEEDDGAMNLDVLFSRYDEDSTETSENDSSEDRQSLGSNSPGNHDMIKPTQVSLSPSLLDNTSGRQTHPNVANKDRKSPKARPKVHRVTFKASKDISFSIPPDDKDLPSYRPNVTPFENGQRKSSVRLSPKNLATSMFSKVQIASIYTANSELVGSHDSLHHMFGSDEGEDPTADSADELFYPISSTTSYHHQFQSTTSSGKEGSTPFLVRPTMTQRDLIDELSHYADKPTLSDSLGNLKVDDNFAASAARWIREGSLKTKARHNSASAFSEYHGKMGGKSSDLVQLKTNVSRHSSVTDNVNNLPQGQLYSYDDSYGRSSQNSRVGNPYQKPQKLSQEYYQDLQQSGRHSHHMPHPSLGYPSDYYYAPTWRPFSTTALDEPRLLHHYPTTMHLSQDIPISDLSPLMTTGQVRTSALKGYPSDYYYLPTQQRPFSTTALDESALPHPYSTDPFSPLIPSRQAYTSEFQPWTSQIRMKAPPLILPQTSQIRPNSVSPYISSHCLSQPMFSGYNTQASVSSYCSTRRSPLSPTYSLCHPKDGTMTIPKLVPTSVSYEHANLSPSSSSSSLAELASINFKHNK